jgi:hypothetical protein
MADKVMRISNEHIAQQPFFKPSVMNLQRKCTHCEEEKRKLQRKESNNDEAKTNTSQKIIAAH